MTEPAVGAGGATYAVRVYWEDTDASGIVYHASYLRFAERARTELLRQAGLDQSRLLAERGIAFTVRNLAIDYRRPARLDDALTVSTRVSRRGAASLVANQAIRRDDDELARLVLTLACVDRRGRPVRLPGAVTHAFAQLENRDLGGSA